MALQKTMTLVNNFGTTSILQDCYVVVTSVAGDKSNIIANVGIYEDQTKQRLYKSEEYTFVPDMDGGNFIQQSYLYLKTTESFSGATDC